ncbi:NAD(P)-dependent oxidoreductase [Agathobaculum sp. NTUH-O15-33]|nr:NAD(P)-dependent oxidoreductase [Agathobaculum sp. NTUH-O15-33]WNX84889.1 NAD(P)-dependent oxidoreductase [Agathobaculum sp. NTUH-O15-33]
MYNVKLYNKISKVGLDDLDAAKYACSEDFSDYDAVLVRSAKLHDVEFPKNLKCIARAGAGVNNIPIDRCSEEGIVVFNTPGANANAVKELVICAMLLASRKIVQGANWVRSLKGTPDIGPAAEKGKATYAGPEIAGKRLGVIGLGAIGVKVANAAIGLDMDVWGYDPFLVRGRRVKAVPRGQAHHRSGPDLCELRLYHRTRAAAAGYQEYRLRGDPCESQGRRARD